jgi:hypothetical protein
MLLVEAPMGTCASEPAFDLGQFIAVEPETAADWPS